MNLMRPWFDELDVPLPKVRIGVGFPSTGDRSKRIGECWTAELSADGTNEIIVHPGLSEPMEVLAVVGHELVHAAVGIPAGHGPAFRRVALAIGLQGPMRSTTAGPGFVDRAEPVLARIGPYPHAELTGSGRKKQKGRMHGCRCPAPGCKYTVRVANKWIKLGTPICPVDRIPMVQYS